MLLHFNTVECTGMKETLQSDVEQKMGTESKISDC